MSFVANTDNKISSLLANPPQMSSGADMSLIKALTGRLDMSDVVVEFGPWLGAVSRILAKSANLHVVDSFIWTKDHSKKVPNVLAPNESFRPIFEKVLAFHKCDAAIYETTFETFSWQGPDIDLTLIDGPKSAKDLSHCLRAIGSNMSPSGLILIKSVLNPLFWQMGQYVGGLLQRGEIELVDLDIPYDGDMVAIRLCKPLENAVSVVRKDEDLHLDLLQQSVGAKIDHPFHLAAVIAHADTCEWSAAHRALAEIAPSPSLLKIWDKAEGRLMRQTRDPDQLAHLSDLVAIHLGSLALKVKPLPISQSAAHALRGMWLNRIDTRQPSGEVYPDMLCKAFDFGYLAWPNKIRIHVYQKDVLDIGCGAGLHGLGFLAAGAHRYCGVDPELNKMSSRIKNLNKSRKDDIGFTPNDMETHFADIDLSIQNFETFNTTSRFDIAVMHDVSEHLANPKDIFRNIAECLKPNGKVIFNHHNFNCWSGHHQAPKTIDDIDEDDEGQKPLMDWRHLTFDAPPDHYIAKKLNRLSLSDLEALLKKNFTIEFFEDKMSSTDSGRLRLTLDIEAAHPHLSKRDFLTQNTLYVLKKR